MSRNAKTANRSLDVRHLAKGVCRKKDFSVQLCGISVPPWWNYSEKINHRDTEIAQRSTEFIFPTDSEAGDSVPRHFIAENRAGSAARTTNRPPCPIRTMIPGNSSQFGPQSIVRNPMS